MRFTPLYETPDATSSAHPRPASTSLITATADNPIDVRKPRRPIRRRSETAHTNAGFSSIGLRQTTAGVPTHPSLLVQAPLLTPHLLLCGIIGCDCAVNNGISSQNFHHPLAIPHRTTGAQNASPSRRVRPATAALLQRSCIVAVPPTRRPVPQYGTGQRHGPTRVRAPPCGNGRSAGSRRRAYHRALLDRRRAGWLWKQYLHDVQPEHALPSSLRRSYRRWHDGQWHGRRRGWRRGIKPCGNLIIYFKPHCRRSPCRGWRA